MTKKYKDLLIDPAMAAALMALPTGLFNPVANVAKDHDRIHQAVLLKLDK